MAKTIGYHLKGMVEDGALESVQEGRYTTYRMGEGRWG